jgi:hypothetical protein
VSNVVADKTRLNLVIPVLGQFFRKQTDDSTGTCRDSSLLFVAARNAGGGAFLVLQVEREFSRPVLLLWRLSEDWL